MGLQWNRIGVRCFHVEERSLGPRRHARKLSKCKWSTCIPNVNTIIHRRRVIKRERGTVSEHRCNSATTGTLYRNSADTVHKRPRPGHGRVSVLEVRRAVFGALVKSCAEL